MALVLGGAMGVRRVRDSCRVREGSLSSLTEEEAAPEHRSVLEVCDSDRSTGLSLTQLLWEWLKGGVH